MQSVLTEDPSTTLGHKSRHYSTRLSHSCAKRDHNAIVLRFFENKNMRDVGLAVGTSEDAAKMRVNRALEKLRGFLVKRGLCSTTAIIAGAISAKSVQVAPVALAKSVAAVTVAKGAAASGSTLTIIKASIETYGMGRRQKQRLLLARQLFVWSEFRLWLSKQSKTSRRNKF